MKNTFMDPGAEEDEDDNSSRPGFTLLGDGLPTAQEFVIVLTALFRCLASCGSDGVWREVETGDVLEGVIGWKQIGD